MSFTKKQKNFIINNFSEMSVKDMSLILKCSEKEITEFLAKNNFTAKKINDKTQSKKENVFGEFEFQGVKKTFFDNFYFWIGVTVFLFLLYYRSFGSVILSDEQDLFNNLVKGNFTWSNYFFGSAASHYISYLLFGISAPGFRFIGLLLHLSNLFLFFHIFRNFISEKILKFAVIIIACHSLIVEPLTWVAAIPYTYHLLIYLLIAQTSLYFERTKNYFFLISYYLLVLNFTLSGGHTNYAPLFAILFNLIFLKRSFKREAILSGFLLLFIPLFTILNRQAVESRIASLTTGPYLEKYTQTLPFTVAKSLELIVFPYNLALFHEETLNPTYYTFARVITVAFFALVLYLFIKKKYYSFGLISLGMAFCIYIFSPVQISWFVAERYLYFPVFIFAVFFGIFINFLNSKIKNLGLFILSAYFFFFTFISFKRFDDWESLVKLWESNVKIAPDSYRIRNNLAEAYSGEKKFDLAEKQLIQAIRISPNFAEAHFNLANAFIAQNKIEQAEVALKKTIELNPEILDSYVKLAMLNANRGKFSEAYANIDKVLLIYPDLKEVINLRNEIQKYEQSKKN